MITSTRLFGATSAVFVLVLVLVGCGAGPSATAPAGTPVVAAPGQTVGLPSLSPGSGPGTPPAGGTQPPGGNGAPTYEEGAASATFVVNSVEHKFAGGTCTTVSSPIHVFEAVIDSGDGTRFSIYVASVSQPIVDGQHTGAFHQIGAQVGGELYIGTDLTVNIRDGVTTGDYVGRNANPSVPISGTFNCAAP